MGISEIDAIFGGGGLASSSSLAGPSKAKPSKKSSAASASASSVNEPSVSSSNGKRKRKVAAPADDSSAAEVAPSIGSASTKAAASEGKELKKTKKARAAPVTILDPSARIESDVGKASAKEKGKAKAKAKGGKESTAAAGTGGVEDDLGSFTNSRGNGRGRTEEGFAIYSENELKLGRGGDTPLCPFDCDCCF